MATDQNLNILDLQNLLESQKPYGSNDAEEEKGWKKHIKLAVIHVGLLVASILYAGAGSLIFHSVEMPNERSVKRDSVERILNFREVLVSSMWNNSRYNDVNESEWRSRSSRDLSQLTDMLYRAYKKEFVRFRHVTMLTTNVAAMANDNETDPDIWSKHSAFFFCITTMATIGYGNIVPVTLNGRIICVVFAIFGTPLAIITIGDFGKFLSEIVVVAYKGYKKVRNKVYGRFPWLAQCAKWMESKPSDDLFDDDEEDDEISTFEDILVHRIRVPVVLVFGTLVLYIALGGFLFEFLEGWSYIDSFYFCFISCTTVGFGDLVPKEHKYMWIMLLYIGIGLAITTMCIDLVGRQYVWKIHYFGRKFKEADLLQLLRRKRMIQRRLAIAQQNPEIRQIIFENLRAEELLLSQAHHAAAAEVCSPVETVNTELAVINPVDLMSAQWPVDNVYSYEEPEPDIAIVNLTPTSPVSTTPSYYERLRMLLLGKRDSDQSPSGPSVELHISLDTAPSVYDREISMKRQAQSVTSWTPSGPDVSIHCSLTTSPSVYERENLYEAYGCRNESPKSFAYNFPLPSPDFEELARSARTEVRNASCPPIVLVETLPPPKSPSTSSVSSPDSPDNDMLTPPEEPIRTPSPIVTPSSPLRLLPPPSVLSLPAPSACLALTYGPLGLSEIEAWDSYKIMLEQSSETNLQIPNICVEQPSVAEEESDDDVYPPSLLSPLDLEPDLPSTSVSTPISSPAESVLDFGDAELIELAASDSGMSGMSTETEPPMQDIPPRPDGPVFFHRNLPVFSVSMRTVETEQAMQNVLQCPEQCLSSEIPQMVTENYCFVVDGDKLQVNDITSDDNWWKPTGKPTKYYFSDDLKTFQKVNIILVKGKVISARLVSQKSLTSSASIGRSFSLSHHNNPPSSTSFHKELSSGGGRSQTPSTGRMLQQQLRHRKSEEFKEPILEHGGFGASRGDGGGGGGDDDDSVDTPPLSRSPLPPPPPPPHGPLRHHKTEAALHLGDVSAAARRAANRSGAFRQSRMSESRDSSAEHLVAGLAGGGGDVFYTPTMMRSRTSSQQSRTGRGEGSMESLHHYPLENVQSNPVAPATAASAVAGHKLNASGSVRGALHKAHEVKEVPLEKVYKVTRFYSFWKSCTSFHRIITVIAPLTETNINPQFKKRIFVQYLWRNAKESDKLRVSKEFDPKKALVNKSPKPDASKRRRVFHL